MISRFTRGYEVVAADIVESNEELSTEGNRYYYTQDEQGSTIFITDKNQQIKNEYYYDAFGNALNQHFSFYIIEPLISVVFSVILKVYQIRSIFTINEASFLLNY